MAKRYGGEFSPDGAEITKKSPKNQFRGRKAHKSNIKAKLLFLVPLPLLFSALGALSDAKASSAIWELGAFATLMLAAWLLRDGLLAEEAYNARKVARPPVIPRKLFASVLTGAGVGLAAFFGWGQPLIQSALFAILAAGTHCFTFGLDPLTKKGMEGFNEFETNRVATAIEKAEKLLAETISAAKRFNDRALEGRVERMAAAARDMFRTVEEDPRDLNSARKFLSVYLKGARDATIKFADINARNPTTEAHQDYEALLTDLETSFAAKQENLLLEDRTDLDVEIDVLRQRLQQEGVKAQ